MTRKDVYLIIDAILCSVVTGLLAAGAVCIYMEGVSIRNSGDSLASIYTREKIAEYFAPIAPVLFICIGFLIAGIILGICDENASRPVAVKKISALPAKKTSPKKIKWIRIIIGLAAVCMIIAGIFNGSLRDVLIKAINICSECIGLG